MAYVTRGQGIGAIVLGTLKLILGLVIVIIGFVLNSKVDNALVSCYWAGFIFLLPGIFGIIAGATKNGCCMITYMTLNIIFFILFGVGAIVIFIAVAAYATVIDSASQYCIGVGDYCECTYNGESARFHVSCSVVTDMVGALWAIAISCLFAGILLLASSILGCISSCCTSPPPTGFVYQEQPAAHAGVVITSQQQMTGAAFAPPPGYTPPTKPGVI